MQLGEKRTRKKQTYGTTKNKNPLLLPPDPLTDLIRRLGQGAARHVRTRGGDAVEFEERRDPAEGDGVATPAVMDLEMGVFGVHAGVQGVVEGEKSGGGEARGGCWG